MAQAASARREDAAEAAAASRRPLPRRRRRRPSPRRRRGRGGAPLDGERAHLSPGPALLTPDEGGWFDAIVTDYRPTGNEHCLTYEINTPNGRFEWANISSFDAREFKLVEGDPVNINDLKFYSQGIVLGAETASHNQSVKATHAAVGGIDNLVKKVAKSADPTQVAEAKGNAQRRREEALVAQLLALRWLGGGGGGGG